MWKKIVLYEIIAYCIMLSIFVIMLLVKIYVTINLRIDPIKIMMSPVLTVADIIGMGMIVMILGQD